MSDKCLFFRQAVLGNRERLFFMPHKLLVPNYHPNSSIFSLKAFIEWKILLECILHINLKGDSAHPDKRFIFVIALVFLF